MDAKKEFKPHEEGERKIPVFTVLKNGAILKNIFIVNNPAPSSLSSVSQNPDQEYEEILTVGRHPNCNIMLTHPSISRFHLQIHSEACKQRLSVMDLSSVHGTWVSEKKVEPGECVELMEGDTVRLGGSSRLYRLHWIPMSRAYDLENPFVPPELHVSMTKEKEEETYQDEKPLSIGNENIEEKDSLVVQGKEEEKYQDNNWFSVDNRDIHSLDPILDDLDSLFSGVNLEWIGNREIPSAPPLPEFLISEEKEVDENPSRIVGEPRDILSPCSGHFGPGSGLGDLSLPVGGVILGTEGQQLEKENWSPKRHSVNDVLFEIENLESPSRRSEQEFKPLENIGSSVFVQEGEATNWVDASRLMSKNFIMENSSLSVEKFPEKTINQQVNEENQDPQPLLALLSLPNGGNKDNFTAEQTINLLVSPDSASCDEENHLVAQLLEETEHVSVSRKDHGMREISSLHSVPIATKYMDSSLVPGEGTVTVLSESTEKEKMQTVFAAAGLSEAKLSESSSIGLEKQCSIWSRRGKPASVKIQTGAGKSRGKNVKAGIDDEVESYSQEDIENNSLSKAPFTGLLEQEEIYTPEKENFTPNALVNSLSKKGGLEETKHSKSSASSASKGTFSTGIHPEKEPLQRAGIDAKVVLDSREDIEKNSSSKALFTGLHEQEEVFTPDKENFTPKAFVNSLRKKGRIVETKNSQSRASSSSKVTFSPGIPPEKELLQRAGIGAEVELDSQEDTEKNSTSKALFTGLHEQEEIFTPDKENFTPKTLVNSFRKKGRIEATKHFKSCLSSSSKVILSPGPEKDMTACLDNGNPTQKICQERESARPASINRVRLDQEIVPIRRISERVPFQPLLVDPTGKSKPDASIPETAMRSCNSKFEHTNISSDNPTGEARRSWTMIVDSTTLLNKESRKSLHLLQGLKGTHLIIPRTVIRELDCLKRRCSLFRRTTEAPSALEWIEECMLRKTWWIHVQSSSEEGSMIAPTPPLSPQSCYSDGRVHFSHGIANSMLFSSHGSLSEIVSPTAEDHILDCALLIRKTNTKGRLVLLSDNVTLKIKAMAEGLICETAPQFRESLVNPFSERFLWADSSPRGRTWSYLDDMVLREQYCRCPFKKSAKGESAKGLKLILYHNSQYGRISSVS
ncbi:FHA domain-containing protein PS1 [Juglans microcarpa x Juglans regia]|uniref:FHA domain-containing protein PS1 n=1 Tax=Juglans microcarpa x Juglans regia TaxID=2249226 RepID=UPI001B7ED3C0|nr:FHA domain-containing protein PS1 [Juglans microcarpa x Juglans regia]